MAGRQPSGAQPCPPWAYGKRVAPGPTWDDSGFGPQNLPQADGSSPVFGTTKVPDDAILTDWAQYVVIAADSGMDMQGGWAPHRSLCVEWATHPIESGQHYYYKSADQGMYDLYYFPDGQEGDALGEALHTMINLFIKWKFMVQSASAKWAAAMPDGNAVALFKDRIAQALQHADEELTNVFDTARCSLHTP